MKRDYQILLEGKYDFVRDRTYIPAGSDRQDRRIFEKQLDQHLRAI